MIFIKTSEITGGAVMAALAVAIMYVFSLFPSLTLTGAALAGFAIMAVLLKWGSKPAFLAFFTATFLSLLLISNKEAPLLFLLFFGYYPMCRELIERVGKPFWCWVLKILLSHVSIGLLFLLLKLFFVIPEDMTRNFLFTYILMLVTFVLYDIAFTKLIALAKRRMRAK